MPTLKPSSSAALAASSARAAAIAFASPAPAPRRSAELLQHAADQLRVAIAPP
jgi:hypothetical protein